MVSITPNLTTARRALEDARAGAAANALDATYQLSGGRFTPLAEWSATVARLDDLLHLLTRLDSNGSN